MLELVRVLVIKVDIEEIESIVLSNKNSTLLSDVIKKVVEFKNEFTMIKVLHLLICRKIKKK